MYLINMSQYIEIFTKQIPLSPVYFFEIISPSYVLVCSPHNTIKLVLITSRLCSRPYGPYPQPTI